MNVFTVTRMLLAQINKYVRKSDNSTELDVIQSKNSSCCHFVLSITCSLPLCCLLVLIIHLKKYELHIKMKWFTGKMVNNNWEREKIFGTNTF